MASEDHSDNLESVKKPRNSLNLTKNGIFMLAVGSAASVVGFGYTYLQAKRAEINEITSKETPKAVREQMEMMRGGTRLAARALAYSWICSIGGVSILVYMAWTLSGAKDLADFRQKAGATLPVIPKPENQGRNDFESLKDLADHLVAEDAKATGHHDTHSHATRCTCKQKVDGAG